MPEAWSDNRNAPPAGDSERVVLLDRDRVTNADGPGYILSWERFRFLPGSKAALSILKERGYSVHIVSNQSAVGRGLMMQGNLDGTTARMLRAIRWSGGEIEGVHYCTHQPENNCGCRKPKTGLLRQVSRKFGVDLGRAWLIGDRLPDDFGEKGCFTRSGQDSSGPARHP